MITRTGLSGPFEVKQLLLSASAASSIVCLIITQDRCSNCLLVSSCWLQKTQNLFFLHDRKPHMEHQLVVTDSEQQVAVQKKWKWKHLPPVFLDIVYKQRMKNPLIILIATLCVPCFIYKKWLQIYKLITRLAPFHTEQTWSSVSFHYHVCGSRMTGVKNEPRC